MLIRRETDNGSNDLHVVYRPCTIDELVGNSLVKKVIKTHLNKGTFPHSTLFTGDAGCGKTTLARIVALTLNCENPESSSIPCLSCKTCKDILNSNHFDVMEVNVGSASGKAAVESIVTDLSAAPFLAKYKVVIFDECHRLSEAAKALLLKHMEDCYSHVYLMFCTNEPDKLVGKASTGNPFIDRCTTFVLDLITQEEMYSLLENVSQFEGIAYNEDVLHYISEISKGVPRKALVALNSVATEGSWELSKVRQLLSDVVLEDNDVDIIELSRTLFNKDFKKACILFDKLVKKYPVESIRIAVCGYFIGCLKRSKNGIPISNALTQLTVPIYTTGKAAEHVFINTMFKVVTFLSK